MFCMICTPVQHRNGGSVERAYGIVELSADQLPRLAQELPFPFHGKEEDNAEEAE